MFLFLACLFLLLPSCSSTNMNNVHNYTIANRIASTPLSMPFHGEYFEILGPETTTKYGQVYWKSQPISLPEQIIKRFDNRVMAVTGYEVDIVRSNKDGTTSSAPSYELYNHHYSGWMYGKNAAPKKEQKGSDDNPSPTTDKPPPMAHGQPLPQWRLATATAAATTMNYPNVQAFSEGNGNEHRNAYKGFAKGFAQLIQSPKTWANNPMIINTNKRLTNDTSPGYISRIVPAHSLAPDDSTYSGILECPCTDRKIKILDGYKTSAHTCASTVTQVSTLNECFAAVAQMGMLPIVSNRTTVPLTVRPMSSSCTVQYDVARNGWHVEYGRGNCSSAPSHNDILGSTTMTFSDDNSSMGMSIELQQDHMRLTLSGPAGRWFAIGFNATAMSGTPYTVVVNGTGHVEERTLGNHAAGAICSSSTIRTTSNQVVDGQRTVVMARPLKSSCFSFDATVASMPVLLAHGPTGTFGYHGKNRASTMLTFIQKGTSHCVCRDPTSNAGTIDGIVFNSDVCAPYPESELLSTKNAICNITQYEGGLYCCHHDSILLDQHQPIPKKTDTWRLKYRFYFEEFMANAPVANAPTLQKDSHQNLFRTWWSTEATNNEYDVPKSTANCLDPTTPASSCIHEIKSQFQAKDMISGAHGGGGSQCMVSGDAAACANVTLIQERDNGQFQLMYMAAHCHTPACMSLELWNDDTGELICRNAPIYGTGTRAQDENSYVISIPPCLFGSKEEGLLPPPVLSLNSNLTTIKRANNTNGHWGVMALWQMRGAYVGGNPPSWNLGAKE